MNPLVALVFGVVVYAERPRSSVIAVAAEALGLAAVLLGIFFLARTEEPRPSAVAAQVDRVR
jgi:hypothetical protein